MFKEFSRCSRRGFILSVITGAGIIAVFAGISVLISKPVYLKAGLVIGLAGARLAEAFFSRSCSLSRAGMEGAVLAIVGILLVIADDLLTGLLV